MFHLEFLQVVLGRWLDLRGPATGTEDMFLRKRVLYRNKLKKSFAE